MARTLWGSPLFASDLLPFSSLPLPVVASLLTAFLFVSAEPVLPSSAFSLMIPPKTPVTLKEYLSVIG